MTDSGDADGLVIRERPVPELTRPRVEAVLEGLVGDREQVPPMYSALKRDGRPLYELAREGREVPREPRRVNLERLTLLGLDHAELEFDVVCSKGTYVRVLGEEIAEALGTCGHLGALRRLWVDPFAPEEMVSLEAIEQWAGEGEPRAEPPAWLKPVDAAFQARPRIDLDAQQSLQLRQGRVLVAPAGSVASASVRSYDPSGRFLGLVTVAPDGAVRVERLFVRGATGPEPPST
jgi:tRNA pseudouridine55 synthase